MAERIDRGWPWSLLAIGATVALWAGTATALFSPTLYVYLNAPPDTIVSKNVTLSAGGYDTARIISMIGGSACSDSSDTLGCGTQIRIDATGAVTCSVFVNGTKNPIPLETLPGSSVRASRIRWIDSVITKDGGGGETVKLDLEGHRRWFSEGGRY